MATPMTLHTLARAACNKLEMPFAKNRVVNEMTIEGAMKVAYNMGKKDASLAIIAQVAEAVRNQKTGGE